MTQLTEQERRALNASIGERWAEFKDVAIDYLSEDEIQALDEKLEEQ